MQANDFKNQNSKKFLAEQPQTQEELQKKDNFYRLPIGPVVNLMVEALNAGDDIENLPDRKQQVNHSQTVKVLKNGKSRRVMLTSEQVQITIEIGDIDKLAGSNKAVKKLLVFTLIKANEQALHNGQLIKEYISFPLQELVDIGSYKSLRSARAGFNFGTDVLTSFKIKGHIQQGKKKESSINALEIPFTGARIEWGQCIIFLNKRINWGFIAQYFTILPLYYFRLSNKAGDLLLYIFYLARQRTKDISKKGYFTISLRAIQHRLHLPNEKGLNNPQRDIKDAIENAIEKIETEQSKTRGNMDFSLLPVYDDTASITDFLDNGYLKVGLFGTFAEFFTAINKDTVKQIEAAQKRQERITEKAIAIKQANK